MAIKKIRRAVHGTCVVVETCAKEMPSKVRVTVQRPRGGCLCLFKTSRQVAKFTFNEGPRTSFNSHAQLDLEKLFKYSRFEQTQVKMCVEMQQGVRRVARVPLVEFLQQLHSSGPTDRFFLYIHESHVTLTPARNSSPNGVPKWAFEGLKQDLQEDQMEGIELAGVVDDKTTNNDIVKVTEERGKNKEAECPTEEATLPKPVMITGREEETWYDEEEEFGSEWVEISLSDSDIEETNLDEDPVITEAEQWPYSYYGMTEREAMIYDEPEKEVAGRHVSLSRLMISWHGAVILACFVTLVAVFDDFLNDGRDLFWQLALLVACYANLATVLLDFFEKED